LKALTTYKYFYFLGIGGIGMSALARYFHSQGWEVVGYDRTPTDLTDALEKEGLDVHFDDEVSNIPAHFLQHRDELLVVYTPAIPKDHLEYNYLLSHGYDLHKRAEVLAAITVGKYTIAVAGTHGKTSTASIISHILKTANIPFYAFLGGIASNYQTNFLAPEPGQESNLVVVEADEFDRSFHQLNPDIAIITAIESDHLDIYGTEEKLREAFVEFAAKLKSGGTLIVHKNTGIPVLAGREQLSYSAFEKADIEAENIVIVNGQYHFNALLRDEKIDGLALGVPGMHNIENSLAAIAATFSLVTDKKIYHSALESFQGVHRRFEVILRNEKIVFVDDYAHHPTEIRVTLQTLKDLYPGKHILGIFQPHLFTRTRDLANEFAESLSLLDALILMPIYPARELPIPGITSQLIFNQATCPDKYILAAEEIIPSLKTMHADVVVTLGAGDIDKLVQPIKNYLISKN